MIHNKVTLADFSFWQDDDYTPYKIDFKKGYQAGLDGVILRAGQNTWVDEDYLDYCRDCDVAGLPRGAYWFFDSRVSPVPQADLFADIIKLSGAFPKLGIWGDYEENYGGVYGGESNFKKFMERLETRFPGKLIGVYTGPAYWREHTTFLGRLFFKKYPLWIANYGVTQPAIPAPWGANDWKIWQFTAQGHGPTFGAESQEVDLNYFNGDLDAYRTFFDIPDYEPSVPPTEEEGENMYDCNVKATTTPYANLRATPNGVDLGDTNLFPNEEFTADNLQNDSLGRPWLHCTKPGKVGWVLAALCDYEETGEPTPETNVLEVYLNGVLEFRKEF